MKVSHIIYKVKDLDKAVAEFRRKGYIVEYGKIKNPHNAIIYFSEGPYLEIMASTAMPKIMKSILRLFGKSKFVDRLDYWDYYKGRYCGLALENYKKDLETEKAILDKYQQKYFQMNSRRNDTKGRKLRFTCLFPDEMQIPFMMTYFNIDPKPKNFVHPNGVKRIKSVSFGTSQKYAPLIKELCDDDTLKLFYGEGVKDLEFE